MKTYSLGNIITEIYLYLYIFSQRDVDDDAYYRSGAGGDIDEAMEDDEAILGGDEDGQEGSDEGEGEDLIENMEQ